MAKIDKLISKFNKVKSKINSIKGIASKIDSINYISAFDELGEQAAEAKRNLELRQQNIKKSRTGGVAKSHIHGKPEEFGENIIYPVHDKLASYITFDIRKRRKRQTGTNKNPGVYKRRSVSLYVPDALISQANVTYRQEGINTFNRILSDAATKVWNDPSSFKEVSMKSGKSLINKFMMESINKMSGGLSNMKYGRAANPQMEQFLDGIPLRSWDFTFDFWPKSREEAKAVKDIIRIFRESMLPDTYNDYAFTDAANELKQTIAEGLAELDPDNPDHDSHREALQATEKLAEEDNVFANASYFNYPNVFDIYYSGAIARHVDGFLPAVCTNAQVDYTGGQKFSTFEDGMPIHIQLTLNFLEIKVMSLGNYNSIQASGQGSLGSYQTYIDGESVHNQSSLTGQDMTDAEIDEVGMHAKPPA